jgi:hypothetical protein
MLLIAIKDVWYAYRLLQLGVSLLKLFTPVKNVLNFSVQIMSCKVPFTQYMLLPNPMN